MPVCWYCYWGWPKAVADIFDDAVKKLGGDGWPLIFGPSRLVWGDENFDDNSIQLAIGSCDNAIVRESLERLLLLSESERCCDLADRAMTESAESLPPPAGMEMVSGM